MDILDLLKRDGYVAYSKDLAHKIGVNETIILMELVSQYKYFKSKNQLVDGEWFYCTIEKMHKNTALSRDQQTRAIKNLRNLNLFDYDRKGLPAKRHFSLNMSNILKLFINDMNGINLTNNAEDARQLQIGENQQTRLQETSKQQCKKPANINNKQYNKKTEEEEAPKKSDNSATKPPDKISQKYQQIFSRELSAEMYLKLLQIFSDNKIIYKALEVAEENGDKPAYLLKLLEDWKEKGFTSLISINKYLSDRQKQSGTEHKNSNDDSSMYSQLHEVSEMEKMGWN